MPSEVHVTTRRRLLGWLKLMPAALDTDTIELVLSHARLSTTWR
jgi:hypothetical protein